ncbi:type II secretion system protein GspF [Candidatus Dependentiae bacterium]|nr:type II secretion system protein GspF [Candidatus Dependentiae bacterium]
MPLYWYDSFNRKGKRISGTIDASSMQSAREILKGQGLMPIKIKEAGIESKKFSFWGLFERQLDTKTKIIFTKQLSVLLKSGVPLLQAFELLIEQFDKGFKRILINIKDGLKAGDSLANQLNKYPKIFSNVYVQLVKAGEASGNLYLILQRLVEYLEKSEETKKKIRKAMAYPIFMISFSIIVVIALLAVLVPRITDMFLKMGQELPAPTLFLKNISDFVLNYYLILLISFLVLVLIFTYWKSTSSGRYKLDKLFLKFPMTSYFSRTKAVVQFSKTLGMLLEADVNLAEALDIVCNIVENKVLVVKLQAAREKIIKEGKIAKYLQETGLFPNIAIYMIKTGEQSGQLAQMLLTVGQDYDGELSELTESLISKIGPVMTIFTGLIIAFIVISIFLPIMEMGNIQGF